MSFAPMVNLGYVFRTSAWKRYWMISVRQLAKRRYANPGMQKCYWALVQTFSGQTAHVHLGAILSTACGCRRWWLGES